MGTARRNSGLETTIPIISIDENKVDDALELDVPLKNWEMEGFLQFLQGKDWGTFDEVWERIGDLIREYYYDYKAMKKAKSL